jgi:hypothetical protein
MGHMGQEIGFCLCRLIMTVSVDTILDDNADLPEKLSILLIFINRWFYSQKEDASGILSVI